MHEKEFLKNRTENPGKLMLYIDSNDLAEFRKRLTMQNNVSLCQKEKSMLICKLAGVKMQKRATSLMRRATKCDGTIINPYE